MIIFIIFNLESLIFWIVFKMQMCSKHVHVNIHVCQVKDRKCEYTIIDRGVAVSIVQQCTYRFPNYYNLSNWTRVHI